MEKSEQIWIASIAAQKGYDYESLYYSDYMYDNESETDAVFEFVDECNEIGRSAFYKKYNEYKLY